MKLRIATAVVASTTLLAGIPALAQDGGNAVQDQVRHVPRRPGTGQAAHGAQDRRHSQKVVDVLTKGGEAKAPHIKPMSTGHRRPGCSAGRVRKGSKVKLQSALAGIRGRRKPVPFRRCAATIWRP